MKPIAIIQQDPIDPPTTIGHHLTSIGRAWELIDAGGGGPIPETLTGYSALIALGGEMNVHQVEEYPFLLHERRLLERCLAEQRPVLAICLGAQLLAEAAGGSVFRRTSPELGWVEVETCGDDPLFAGIRSPFVTMQWHYYSFTLPPGAVRLAARPDGEQAFRLGPCAWAVQFHPEVDTTLADLWVDDDEAHLEELRPGWPDEMRKATQRHAADHAAFCCALIDNFLAAALPQST